jgi:hypothetical protein
MRLRRPPQWRVSAEAERVCEITCAVASTPSISAAAPRPQDPGEERARLRVAVLLELGIQRDEQRDQLASGLLQGIHRSIPLRVPDDPGFGVS